MENASSIPPLSWSGSAGHASIASQLAENLRATSSAATKDKARPATRPQLLERYWTTSSTLPGKAHENKGLAGPFSCKLNRTTLSSLLNPSSSSIQPSEALKVPSAQRLTGPALRKIARRHVHSFHVPGSGPPQAPKKEPHKVEMMLRLHSSQQQNSRADEAECAGAHEMKTRNAPLIQGETTSSPAAVHHFVSSGKSKVLHSSRGMKVMRDFCRVAASAPANPLTPCCPPHSLSVDFHSEENLLLTEPAPMRLSLLLTTTQQKNDHGHSRPSVIFERKTSKAVGTNRLRSSVGCVAQHGREMAQITGRAMQRKSSQRVRREMAAPAPVSEYQENYSHAELIEQRQLTRTCTICTSTSGSGEAASRTTKTINVSGPVEKMCTVNYR